MADFVKPEHSKSEVVSAGKALAGPIAYGPDAYQVFGIAHNWRAAFAFPMHAIRQDLRGKVRRGGGTGLTAARLKRMASIRRKLKSSQVSLYQMQDIAGCRAILTWSV